MKMIFNIGYIPKREDSTIHALNKPWKNNKNLEEEELKEEI